MSDAQGSAQAPAQAPAQAQPNTQAQQPNQPAPTGASADKAPQAVSEAAKEAMRKFKVKVDNQELEVDENELVRGYSHQKAANKKLQEGLAAKKQAEMFISMLKDEGKVLDVLQKVGHDKAKLRKLMESYLTEEIKYEMMDPKDRELLELKKRNAHYEDLEKKRLEAILRQRDDQMKKKFSEDYSQQFTDALKQTKIPANKHTVAEMAKYISLAAKSEIEMSPLEAAKLVREDLIERQRAIYGDAEPETLAEFLGDDLLNKVRTYDVSRLKNPLDKVRTPEEQGELQRQRGAPKKRLSPQEWRAFNRK